MPSEVTVPVILRNSVRGREGRQVNEEFQFAMVGAVGRRGWGAAGDPVRWGEVAKDVPGERLS